jgi:hypothetical protein
MTAHELIEYILAHPVGQTLFDIAAFKMKFRFLGLTPGRILGPSSTESCPFSMI